LNVSCFMSLAKNTLAMRRAQGKAAWPMKTVRSGGFTRRKNEQSPRSAPLLHRRYCLSTASRSLKNNNSGMSRDINEPHVYGSIPAFTHDGIRNGLGDRLAEGTDYVPIIGSNHPLER